MEIEINNYKCIIDDAYFELHSDISKYRILLNAEKIPYLTYSNKLVHRDMLGVVDRTIYVDHINFNTLDNSFSNLRLASITENNRNRRSFKNNKLGVKGVSIAPGNRKSKPFRARITVGRKTIHLGYFSTAEEAAKARESAVKRIFQQFSHS